MTFRVSCTLCGLERSMDDVREILELQEAHQAEYHDRHVLEFEVDR